MWEGPDCGLGSQTILKGVTELSTSIRHSQLLLTPVPSSCEARETPPSFSCFGQVFVTATRQQHVSHSHHSLHKVRASREAPTERL